MKKYLLGELFCGPSGLACGALNADIGEAARIEHAWATDYDADTCRTYIRNICPNDPNSVLCADIRQLDFEQLRALGDIDALAFGFPGNDYSQVLRVGRVRRTGQGGPRSRGRMG